jgi:hypothetical protein
MRSAFMALNVTDPHHTLDRDAADSQHSHSRNHTRRNPRGVSEL